MHAHVAWRQWPRPNSPLASLLAEAGSVSPCSASASRRLPPIDDAMSFASYLQTVGSAEFDAAEPSGAAAEPSGMAEQIRREAAAHRERRRPLPAAGPVVDDEDELRLPAGRFDASAAQPSSDRLPSTPPSSLRSRIVEFSMSPREVTAHLDEHAIAQDEA